MRGTEWATGDGRRATAREGSASAFDSASGRGPWPVAREAVLTRGFTLIEVLAALVIISLGMLGVIEAVTQTASNGAYLRDKTIAHWVAMNQLTKVRLDTRPPKIDKTSDEIEMAQRRWRWTMNVTQTAVESVRRIDISVAPAEADENSSLASLTGFFGAAIAPAASVVSWSGQGLDPGNGGNPSTTQPPEPESTPNPASDPDNEKDSGNDSDAGRTG